MNISQHLTAILKVVQTSLVFFMNFCNLGLKKMGHGGADFFTMNNFVRAVANGADQSSLGTGVLVS